MSVAALARCLLGGLLAFAAIGAHAADAPEADIGALWRDLLDRGSYDTVIDTYDVVLALNDENGRFDASRCAKQADALVQATEANPVGFAVWYAGWRCAEAAGDAALAQVRHERFDALLRHAFASLPPDAGQTAIRVIGELDADAIVEATGMKLVFSYYDPGTQWRQLPLITVLWDEAQSREYLLSFDFLDSWVRLKRDKPQAGYPRFRRELAFSVLRSFAKTSGSPAARTMASLEALRKPERAQVIEELAKQARAGNRVALMALGQTCTMPPDRACGKQHIDVLLSFAEARDSVGLLWLAQAYRAGAGVPRDDKAAATLLDAADARTGNAGVRIRLQRAERNLPGYQGPSPLVLGPIEAAARRGVPAAQAVWSSSVARGGDTSRWTPAQRDAALAAAQRGIPQAQYRWSKYLATQHRDAEALDWLQRAARADHATAQAELARHYMQAAGTTGLQTARYWYARAAQDGDIDAMLWLGRDERERSDRKAAEGWLRSAAYAGSDQGKLELAVLYLYNNAGLGGGPKEAVELLREAGKAADGVQARALLAQLLWAGNVVTRDSEGALELLRGDAARGVADAQMTLGIMLVSRPPAPEYLREGKAFLRKAARADRPAKDRLAAAIWYGYGFERDPREAAALWQQLVDVGFAPSLNNYAWALCTSDTDDGVNAAKGLALAQRAAAAKSAWYGVLDTLAACQAAAGDFNAATRTQEKAVDRFKREQPDEKDGAERLRARVALYSSKQRYRERPGL